MLFWAILVGVGCVVAAREAWINEYEQRGWGVRVRVGASMFALGFGLAGALTAFGVS